MAHEITTSIAIAAPPERVWAALLDFARYPEWNPFVRSIEGRASEGSLLKVKIQPPGGNEMSFRPVVLGARRNEEFRWRGKLAVPGLFEGEHYFLLAGTGENATRFTQGERFSGLLVPLLRKSLDGGTRAGFEAMNLALKQHVEGAAPVR